MDFSINPFTESISILKFRNKTLNKWNVVTHGIDSLSKHSLVA
jgi:hypothetical protein